ncbi:4Fe-4S binding protein [Caminicella sporogenes]|uniref:4Fe-4S binding protein n=1 Tax=Caminicella sporogenes TaxID=166485 RepID=UPI002540CCE5|nr:4Fe-4S binding protein [Caminicella sporogenes]WIF95469.1 4Fe-4S binding protein [Caminicella sporogenes]
MKRIKFFQLIFLGIFIMLVKLGRPQLWFMIFLISIILTPLFGRFYCGWICPIKSLMDIVDWIYKKFKIKRREVPNWIKKPIFRYIVLIIFLGFMAKIFITGRKIPVLIIFTILGVAVTLFFVPSMWHRYFCPYGTLLSFVGLFSKRGLAVENENCIKCGICKSVCPAEAVKMENRKQYPKILNSLCLSCFKCADLCPKSTIKYISVLKKFKK